MRSDQTMSPQKTDYNDLAVRVKDVLSQDAGGKMFLSWLSKKERRLRGAGEVKVGRFAYYMRHEGFNAREEDLLKTLEKLQSLNVGTVKVTKEGHVYKWDIDVGELSTVLRGGTPEPKPRVKQAIAPRMLMSEVPNDFVTFRKGDVEISVSAKLSTDELKKVAEVLGHIRDS
jgi:hypothetical protein